jgi:chromosomal replication initiator protein
MLEESYDVNTAWGKACEILKKQICLETFDHWFQPIVPVNIDKKNIVLGVSDDFFASWFKDNYEDILADALKKAVGYDLDINFELGYYPEETEDEAEEETASAIEPAETHSEAEKEVTEPSLPNCLSRHTFGNSVVGEENRYAYTAAITAAQSPGGVYNPLYIYGGTGMGKTHLLQAVAYEVLQKNPRAVVEYITCEAFLNNYVDSLRNKKHAEFRNHIRRVDVLLVDDVHQLANKTQLQEEFFNTFNSLYNSNKQIILTSDKQPCEIKGLEDRLVSRFEWGITTEITTPEIETRLAILRMKQEEHLIKLDDEVLFFIASRISTSIRRLEGALLRLVAFSSATNCKITIPRAEELLSKLLEEEANNKKVSIENIQKTVADHFDLRVHDILGNKRPKNIAEPRMIAMYIARQITDFSLPEIGLAFGGRNHATVINAVKKIKAGCEKNENMKRTVSLLKRQVQGG